MVILEDYEEHIKPKSLRFTISLMSGMYKKPDRSKTFQEVILKKSKNRTSNKFRAQKPPEIQNKQIKIHFSHTHTYILLTCSYIRFVWKLRTPMALKRVRTLFLAQIANDSKFHAKFQEYRGNIQKDRDRGMEMVEIISILTQVSLSLICVAHLGPFIFIENCVPLSY